VSTKCLRLVALLILALPLALAACGKKGALRLPDTAPASAPPAAAPETEDEAK
jgi:predicted small lipoprotein YifL